MSKRFREAVASSFQPYLVAHGFLEDPLASSDSPPSLAYVSPSFRLMLCGERDGEIYGKVASNSSPDDWFWLGATLAYLAKASAQPVEAIGLSRELERRHLEVAALLAPEAAQDRTQLRVWMRKYEDRAVEQIRQATSASQAKRPWWRFWA